MQKKHVQNLLVIVLAISPLIYLWVVWAKVPDTIAIHYNINFVPDKWAHKTYLLFQSLLLSAFSIGIYFLFNNIHHIDPKRYGNKKNDGLLRIAIITVCFITILSIIIILAITTNVKILERLILPVIGLLFACLGNYMPNLKPNYFAGIRLPWTLSSESNWRKTHQLAGKLWFFGGLVIAVLTSFLPHLPAIIIMFVVAGVLTIVPSWYSYSIFKKERISV